MSPYMNRIKILEDLVFSISFSSIPQITKFLDVFDEEQYLIVFDIIQYAATVRPKQWRELHCLWSQLKTPKVSFPSERFTRYLKMKGINVHTYGKLEVYQNAEEMEAEFPFGSLESFIRNDEIDKLVFLSSDDGFFGRSVSLDEETTTAMINMAAKYGSEQCFMYLKINNCPIGYSTPKFAVMGGNIKIIELCQQNGSNFGGWISTAIEYHHNEILEWILINYGITHIDINICLKSHHTLAYAFFLENISDLSKVLLVHAVESANVEVIASVIKETPIDNTSLQVAVGQGRLNIIKMLLEKVGTFLVPPLMSVAVVSCVQDVIEFMISIGGDINQMNEGFTALINASKMGNFELVKFLVENGAKIDIKTNAPSALYNACLSGSYECVEYLISKGANVCSGMKSSIYLPFFAAVQSDNVEILKLLVSKGANINAQSRHGKLAVHVACKEVKMNALRYLVDNGADIEAKCMFGPNALIFAVSNNNLEATEYLLNKKANIEVQDNEERTPLMYACAKGMIEMTELLISKGANLETKNAENRTAIIYASINGNIEILKILLMHGAKIDVMSKRGETPLIFNAINGRIDQIQLLLSSGADPNFVAENGKSVLMIAIEQNNIGLVKILVESGSDVNLKDQKGRTPLMRAISLNENEVSSFLLNNGVGINDLDSKGYTPLIYAIQMNNNALTFALLKKGANPNYKDTTDTTALMYAIKTKDFQIVKTLVENGSVVDESAITLAMEIEFDEAIIYLSEQK